MAPLRLGTSYWLDARPHRRVAASERLGGLHECDVVVIGGGMTGCAAAYFFAETGAKTILLERNRIGRGSSAASTALLMQEPDVDFADLADRYGFRTAHRMWAYSRASVARMQRTLRAAGARVHTLPSVYCADSGAAVSRLRRELRLRHRAGLSGEWLAPERARELAGFAAPAAILTPGNAQVDPYEACVAVARAAARRGARLFERSPALRVAGVRLGVNVETAHGRVSAKWAVIATGYATPEFKPLAGHFRMMNTYVVATPKLTQAERRAIGLGDVMLWDSARPYHYARWTPDGRLLFGGGDHPQARRATRRALLRARTRQLWDTLVARYPILAGRAPEYAWEGLFATTSDGLPFVGRHRRYPRQLFALGYGGNGMTFGFLAARALVRIAQGKEDDGERLFGFGRLRR
jgi:glycine/D-amino acid oxidase-like deaminating enzyme